MSMSRKKCCVPGCLDSESLHRTMHLFPNPAKDKECFNQWVFSIRGDIIGLDNEDIYKHRSVCHSHFEEKFCCRFNRLSNIAVPTLNLPGLQRHSGECLTAGAVALEVITSVDENEIRNNSILKENINPVTQPLPARITAVKFDKENGTTRPFNEVSVYGRARTVRVYWDGRAPSRAAAALLVALLRHVLRYRSVKLALLQSSPHHLCHLVVYAQKDCQHIDTSQAIYDNVTISPSMAWTGRKCPYLEWCWDSSRDKFAPAPQLQVVGTGAAPASLRLHSLLTPDASRDAECARANHWAFYANATLLKHCGFTTADKPLATVYTLADQQNLTKEELDKRIIYSSLHLKVTPLQRDTEPRSTLFELLQKRKTSFLFLDYDIWIHFQGVLTVTLPPPLEAGQQIDLDPMQSLKVANDFVLRQIAPQILQTLHVFAPSPEDLRNVLLLETEYGIEEAGCAWATKNKAKLDSWYQNDFKERRNHWIMVFLCSQDPDKEEYKKVANATKTIFQEESELNVAVDFQDVVCGNKGDLNNEFLKTTISYRWQTLIGVVAAGQGMAMAAETAGHMGTALMFYDVPAPTVPLGAAARAAAGSVHQLATAIQNFLSIFNWKRLLLISEDTELAKGLYGALYLNKSIALYDEILTNVTAISVLETLTSLKQHKIPRILFVNTSPEIAKTILCAAYELGMTVPDEYTWILREWRSTELKCANKTVQVNFFTISFWWRGGNFRNHTGNRMRKRLDLWGGATWPPLAAPLADALLLLMRSFKEFTQNYPEKYFELHGDGTVQLLLKSLKNQQTVGVVQNLQYDDDGTLASPLVFVDRWKGKQREPILQWRIKNGSVELADQIQQAIYPGVPPTDGSRFCLTPTSGISFLPHCHDFVWLTSVICLLVATLVLLVGRRIRIKRLSRRDSLLTAQLLAQREFVSNELIDRFVDRAALTLYHDLGRGCFGRVRYAILRAPERQPISVAVKELRDDVAPSEESELLREAYTLATLCHDHIVRLIGVCATGVRLLVLLEYAFFGDLREYLYERRHLAERVTETEIEETDEAYHVSSVSLTRMAREVASALEYLAIERLVHRDVRASNCLVDARRSLKLADFGLARKTVSGLDGEQDEYLCQRRGLFPVLWMAPESLERGVFTAASDTWALGVLLLELVSLGARPYGTWAPMRVLRYVSNGGQPPLPADVTPDTRRILMECWRISPEERLTAEALVAELDASREALRPALLPPELPVDEGCPIPEAEAVV